MVASPQPASLALPPWPSSWRERGLAASQTDALAALVHDLIALTVAPRRRHVLVPACWSRAISARATAYSSSISYVRAALTSSCLATFTRTASCGTTMTWIGGSSPRGGWSRRTREDLPARQTLPAGPPCCRRRRRGPHYRCCGALLLPVLWHDHVAIAASSAEATRSGAWYGQR
jgi:hypothetical protein